LTENIRKHKLLSTEARESETDRSITNYLTFRAIRATIPQVYSCSKSRLN